MHAPVAAINKPGQCRHVDCFNVETPIKFISVAHKYVRMSESATLLFGIFYAVKNV